MISLTRFSVAQIVMWNDKATNEKSVWKFAARIIRDAW